MWRVFAPLLAMALGGCVFVVGGGYAAPEAATRIEFISDETMDDAFSQIRLMLTNLGFESEWRGNSKGRQGLALWRHQGEQDLHVLLTAYADPKEGYCGIGVCVDDASGRRDLPFPFIELRLNELRPASFSAGAMTVHNDLMAFLRGLRGKVVVVSDPPYDEATYERATHRTFLLLAGFWLLAWTLFMAILGGTTLLLMGWSNNDVLTRRVILIVVGVTAATPMPFLPSIGGMILIPNLLAVLTGYVGTSSKWLISFAVSALLSTAVAWVLIRGRKAVVPA